MEAAELLLRTAYSTADVARPLRGASQAVLLRVRTRCRVQPAHLETVMVHTLQGI